MRTEIHKSAMRSMSVWLGILISTSAAHGQTLAITRGAERGVREAPASNFTGVARVDMLFGHDLPDPPESHRQAGVMS